MIDKEEFAVAMGMLTDRFNRPLHPSMSRFYYETLSAELDTEEFLIFAARADDGRTLDDESTAVDGERRA